MNERFSLIFQKANGLRKIFFSLEIHAWQFLGKKYIRKEDNWEKVDDLWQEEDH
jgi:hypothetical protein